MHRKAKDGAETRAYLEASARRGNTEAIEALQDRPCPEELAYLVQWAYALCGRSGEGMNGIAPLSYTTIKDWRSECGVPPLDVFEVHALLALDAAIRHPEEPVASADSGEAPVSRALPAWPEQKRGG